ncbi:FAD-dependent oxidoreductase [Rhodohalobacter sulfatireducens]|uniref:FAD-dependent oxidoreductase n=1 Tax=Rhodohalobacter sulfatireducens TaxID=2911366 RepID=A0ABS9KHC1_9BACT|nr:FAD-dependent oxidoreductase [Rhodohalobacter sulfatireducens]MCG2590241.1 FAD-dependent oxidoreductase [Rhodohalobacter sulfatireducens]
MKTKIILFLTTVLLSINITDRGSASSNYFEADVIIYGGTSAAVTAAVKVARTGQSVIMVSPDIHLGGLSSGGLGFTDTGNKEVIGGLSREFYQRVYEYYQQDETWQWQDRSEYGNRGQGTTALDEEFGTMWIFEPHIAEQVFEDFINDEGITVLRDEWLDRKDGVVTEDGRIVSFETLSGKRFKGKMFIDATYEGDLMAAAGVSYHVGRESNDTYDEEWNGVQTGVYHHNHFFPPDGPHIDPYVSPGDPSSGIIGGVSVAPPGEKGSGDHRVQAYCFRMCLSDHPDNKVPFPKPDNYEPSQYILLLRLFESGWHERNNFFTKYDEIPNRKTDTNNHGPVSTDYMGMNYDYPEASYERREQIIQEHEDYQKGMMYFLANDPRVPREIQNEVKRWGLAKDEFTDNGNWPHQLYIREARRMIGDFVMTEHEVLGNREVPKSIGMGSYTLDSHNVQRYITPEGYVQNEGDIGVSPDQPYEIAYGSLIPKKDEIQNLLVPVAMSASHIAFGSIRMEPVFMVLGHSAAAAAVLAIREGQAVQDVNYNDLRNDLEADGQVLEYSD